MIKKIIIILPLIVLGYLLFEANTAYKNLSENIFEEEIKEEKNFLDLTSQNITDYLNFYKNSLIYLSSDAEIKKISRKGELEIENFFKSHSSILSGVTRIDSEGVITFTFPINESVIGKYVGDQEHNAQLLKQHRPVISDLFNTVQGYKAIVYAVPVFNKGKFNGCISAVIPLNKIQHFLKSRLMTDEDANFVVITNSGEVIASSYGSDIELNNLDIFPDSLKNEEIKANLLAGKKTNIVDVYFSTSQDIPNNNFIIYNSIPLENTLWKIVKIKNINTQLNALANLKPKIELFVAIGMLYLFLLIIYIYYLNYRKRKSASLESKKALELDKISNQVRIEYDKNEIITSLAENIFDLTGYSKEHFLNKSLDLWFKKIHPSDRKTVKSEMKLIILNDKPFHGVYRFLSETGNYIYLEQYSSKIKISENRAEIISLVKDISPRIEAEKELIEYRNELEKLVTQRTKELKLANEELRIDIKKRVSAEAALIEAKKVAEYSDKLKSEFLAQVSHEIRTPINTILSFSSLIKMELGVIASPSINDSFNSIDKAAKRLMRTISLIVNMSEIETNSYKPYIEPINIVNEVLKPLTKDYETVAREKGVFLKLNNYLQDDAIILGDLYTITQIFENLIDNAIKYTNQGAIEIKVYNDDQYLTVEVNDTGIGINEDYIPHLFNKFSQEEQGYTRKFEGNGLGLALVKEYCKINNAEIDVESEKGNGSSFRVTFQIKI